jgi:hypothetical protein
MPSPKQMSKIARTVDRVATTPALAPNDDLPPEYWQALLSYLRAEAGPSGSPVRRLRLSEISQHLLRVTCCRCGRIVEVQKVDATRLFGADAIWRDVGQRLLDSTCAQRTGLHEEDGCWPSYDVR